MIVVRSVATSGSCSVCGSSSVRVHSRYERKLNDLPIGGRCVQLIARVRRFCCDIASCPRRIFAERFDGVVAPMARRTKRLDEIVFCLAIALGDRPAAALAKRIRVTVSNDTLLRAVRRRGSSETLAPSVVGIDDSQGFRRGERWLLVLVVAVVRLVVYVAAMFVRPRARRCWPCLAPNAIENAPNPYRSIRRPSSAS